MVLYYGRRAIYFPMMASKGNMHELRIVGIALAGSDGSPLVVFQDTETGDFLPLPTDPFDAEIVIREFTGDGDGTAVGWLVDAIGRNTPRGAVVETDADGPPKIRFSFGWGMKGLTTRVLPLGEGLGLCRRLDLPVSVDAGVFESFSRELDYLRTRHAFRRNFLYLTPPQYAPTIPVE